MINADSDALPYLAGLRLEGRRVVIIGAGRVVARRWPAFERSKARVEVIAPEADPVIAEAARAGRLSWSRRPFRSGDLAGAWYAMTATDDAECNAAVAAEAEEKMIFCVRADDAHDGSAWTPATELSGEVLIGLLSRRPEHHRDPRRTRELRDQLAELAAELQERQRDADG